MTLPCWLPPVPICSCRTFQIPRHSWNGFGLDALAGQALFVGPTAYVQLSEQSRLTASWSMQAWGHTAGAGTGLDLLNFERHQARLVYGVNF